MKRKTTRTKDSTPKVTITKERRRRKKKFPGYPLYPEGQDIYSKEEKVDNVNMDDGTIIKEEKEKPGKKNEKGPGEIHSGDDLDVPGAELDDTMEDNGDEDEENNYYSLGGDEHDDE
jgi:hypothetical protein